MEIIIDGVPYEAHEKKEEPFEPNPGDFIIYTQPSFGFWIIYKVLFFATKGKKIAMVSENQVGNLCACDCTYKNFQKKYRHYDGEPGAHQKDQKWWSDETGRSLPDLPE